MFFIKFNICVCIDKFSVEIGLFVIINLGLVVIVWVMFKCWCCLLENLWGYLYNVFFGIFIIFNKFLIFFFFFWLFNCLKFWIGLVIIFSICFLGFKFDIEFWKIIWIFLLYLIVFWFCGLVIFCFW